MLAFLQKKHKMSFSNDCILFKNSMYELILIINISESSRDIKCNNLGLCTSIFSGATSGELDLKPFESILCVLMLHSHHIHHRISFLHRIECHLMNGFL